MFNKTFPVLIIAATLGCSTGPRRAPVRTSPTLEAVALPGTFSLRDRLRSDLAVYDTEIDRVVTIENGARLPVQDRAIASELRGTPLALRVFADNSIAVAESATSVVVFPAAGAPQRLSFDEEMGAIDGASINDFWIVRPTLVNTSIIPRVICHWVNLRNSGCIEVAASDIGGYDEVFAVAADGSLYINDRDRKLFHVVGANVAEVQLGHRLVSRLRHAGTRLLAISNDNQGPGLFELRDQTALAIDAQYVVDAVGTDTAIFYGKSDTETVQMDPGCRRSWLGPSCPRTTVWSEYVIYRYENGRSREIAHQSCLGPAPCNAIDALAVDGATIITLGTSPQRIPSATP